MGTLPVAYVRFLQVFATPCFLSHMTKKSEILEQVSGIGF